MGENNRKFSGADIAAFVPLIGGGLHGLIKPAKGANRLETAAVQGAGGFGGGVLGMLGGLAAGGALGAAVTDKSSDDRNRLVAVLAILGAFTGATLGTAGGTYLGRKMTEREIELPVANYPMQVNSLPPQ